MFDIFAQQLSQSSALYSTSRSNVHKALVSDIHGIQRLYRVVFLFVQSNTNKYYCEAVLGDNGALN